MRIHGKYMRLRWVIAGLLAILQFSICCLLLLHQAFDVQTAKGTRMVPETPETERIVTSGDDSAETMNHVEGQQNDSSMAKVINDFSYPYLQSCDAICRDNGFGEIFLLILVSSAISGKQGRKVVRETWGSVRTEQGKRIETVFILGQGGDHFLAQSVDRESKRFGDIVQADFYDSYHNLTTKTIMGLKWATTYCANVSYVMKTDDDSFISLANLVRYLKNLPQRNYFYTGNCFKDARPVRSKEFGLAKWIVTREEYPDKFFPPYCAGAGYILSRSSAAAIVEQAPFTKLMRFEDVSVGLCAKNAGIRPEFHYREPFIFSSHHATLTVCSARYHILSHFHKPDEIRNMWKLPKDAKAEKLCPPNPHGS